MINVIVYSGAHRTCCVTPSVTYSYVPFDAARVRVVLCRRLAGSVSAVVSLVAWLRVVVSPSADHDALMSSSVPIV